MTKQYLRQISLTVESTTQAIDLSQLKITFQVLQANIQSPNICEARVYNLSDQTVKKIRQGGEFTKVTLKVGYQEDNSLTQLFSGTIKQTRSGRLNATDTFLDIFGTDADRPYNQATVNKTIAAGYSLSDLHLALGSSFQALGATVGTVPGDLSAQVFPRGRVLYGMTKDHARDFANTTESDWSLQDGSFVVIPKTGVTTQDAIVLTAFTGMIGIPQQTENGISVRCLLNPKLRYGARLKIDNKSVIEQKAQLGDFALNPQLDPNTGKNLYLDWDGVYKVVWVNHAGDTRDNQWYSDITCIATNAMVPLSQTVLGYGVPS